MEMKLRPHSPLDSFISLNDIDLGRVPGGTFQTRTKKRESGCTWENALGSIQAQQRHRQRSASIERRRSGEYQPEVNERRIADASRLSAAKATVNRGT
nr:hypothetical protein CFP56_12056 [Quercus suber]